MDNYKTYKSYSIPSREQLSIKETPAANPEDVPLADTAYVELEVYESPYQMAVSSARAETVKPSNDPLRTLYYAMRQVSYGMSDRMKIFYRQALLAKDYEDDYDEETPFSAYFPHYQIMGYSQMRTYFTWRKRVRNGEVSNISTSYAFLYVYELINNIGINDPQEGLDKLYAFWQAFRVYDTVLDRYLLQWLKDYCVYYPLEASFSDFVTAHKLQAHYPSVFAYGSGEADSFGIFSSISQYDITKSRFYSEQTERLISDCFYFVLARLREAFKDKKKCFEDYIFHVRKRNIKWTPFDRALFYPAFKQKERTIQISPREEYEYADRSWSYKAVMLTDHGRYLVGYIIKEMESNLRAREKFKYKLSVKTSSYRAVNWQKIKELDIDLAAVIKEGVEAYYAHVLWTEVSVDCINLALIRKEAFETQEKLLVPEDDAILDEALEPVIGASTATAEMPVTDSWSQLRESLTMTEMQALRLILQEQDIKAFAARNNIMPEVLIDGINDKAMDTIGDTPLELDDTVFVYEEYLEMLKEMVEEWKQEFPKE